MVYNNVQVYLGDIACLVADTTKKRRHNKVSHTHFLVSQCIWKFTLYCSFINCASIMSICAYLNQKITLLEKWHLYTWSTQGCQKLSMCKPSGSAKHNKTKYACIQSE